MTTKADQARLDIIHRLPCIACTIFGRGLFCGRVEAHHIVDGGYRKHSGGHQATLPLGKWHHRGEPLTTEWTVKEMTATFGPSLAKSKREFIRVFGTERELLAKVDGQLRSATLTLNQPSAQGTI
jgi:hypothetical protein